MSPIDPRDGIDWGLVAAFRSQASDQLSAAVGQDRSLDPPAQQELGRSIILELLSSAAADAVSAGRESWPVSQQAGMADAVFNALFGLGRFQPLVDDETIENIEVYGNDNVLLEHSDGTLRDGPNVAEDDQELLEFISFLGSKSGNGRPFSEAQPRLHLRLDGGARLAATAWVTPRPSIVIRRHRLRDTDLGQLAETGMLSQLQATFLEAAVRARLNIVVSGAQGAGKTTLVRGLCAAIDPWEKIGTFETEYELFLDELTHKHKRVIAWESRPGSGEVGMNGRQAGEITLDDLLIDSFRFILGRTIVGEVRGREILSMIKAMQSTSGSISTTHAANARAAIRKLITCAMEAGNHISEGYATSAVAGHIDLIVQLHLQTAPMTEAGGRRRRWISEIISVEPGELATGYATQQVFRPRADGPAIASVMPEHIRNALAPVGFDVRAFEAECRLHAGLAS
ncbi:CpaF family protein [Allobranchiibius sp. CTAmp26]|uniref:CpaF family protein n=1 Tax=Allobranchiibius sp. CTAmp26 TaxID=2815214 RepID=UPI001FB59A57|nr:ATPase, T2SS/T4P/T4SS family [Allobranchiibius sp. CTAmp26]